MGHGGFGLWIEIPSLVVVGGAFESFSLRSATAVAAAMAEREVMQRPSDY